MKNERIALLASLAVASARIENEDHPKLDSSSLELVFSDETYQLTGVAVSRSGRLFTNYPLWSVTYKNAVVEIFPDDRTEPYPGEFMNSWKKDEEGLKKWVCVQAVHIDDEDNLWVVDAASPYQKGVYQNSHKLVKINLDTNTLEKVYYFKDVADNQSYINDVRVDTIKKYAYLTNSNEGGIVVVDLNTGKIRQVLQGHYSVISDPGYKFMIDGKEVRKNGAPLKFNSDGLALTPDGMYLYYKPLTDDKLYRIRTEYLRDENLTSLQLGDRVEDLGHFTTTDGMICDYWGNLYLGDLENSRIIKISPDLKMSVLIQDSRLIWPDSYQIMNGYLYVSCSQIHRQPDCNDGMNMRTSPFTIYRIKLPPA